MYQSRLHFEHDNIHLALDSMTGDILELFTLDDYDNIIKSSMFEKNGTFEITLERDEKSLVFSTPHSRDALGDESLRCSISSQLHEGGLDVTVSYSKLKSGDVIIPIDLEYTARLTGSEVRWSMRIKNGPGEAPVSVEFPIINGIWMGETWKDHVLYFPNNGGKKYINPVEYLSDTPEIVQWRWQEYRYRYPIHGVIPSAESVAMGGFGLRDFYPGTLSMSWLSVDSPSQSLYFACHSTDSKIVKMSVFTYGKAKPGLCLSTAFFISPDATEWSSPEVISWLHNGDWHDGARRYRAHRTDRSSTPKPAPSWLASSQGLVAHYDFKYQNGGIVHRYCDIPKLAKEAKELGFCHILLAGWHKDGFDCGFPMYVYDEELGTEEEFIEGVRAAKEMGVHVTFYLNVLIHNRAYNRDKVDKMGVVDRNGRVRSATYGNPNIKFSVMCTGSHDWQELLAESIARATEKYGADGVYLDQLSCAPRICYSKEHGHAFDSWSDGYTTLLKRIAKRYRETHDDELYISGEWMTDTRGGLIDFGLCQTFYKSHTGSFPEMYRYTFPDHGIVDMIYPSRNLAMRPTHVSQVSEQIMARLFCNGSYFWVYDLVDDNTFSRDPVGLERLKKIYALSARRKELAPDALYRDTDGISCDIKDACISRFEGKELDVICIYAYKDSESVRIGLDGSYSRAVQYFPDGTEKELAPDADGVTAVGTTSVIALIR